MGTLRTGLRVLCMGFAVLAAVACGDDDDGGNEPEAGSNGDGGVVSGRGGSSGGGSGTGGRSGSGGRGGSGGQMGIDVMLDGCCTAEGVCGYISELRMACITQSDLLDPPISAGPACDGPVADADGGTADEDGGTDEGLPPVDPDCPTYEGTYTPAGP
jgi:hypothetical protein